MAAKTEKKTYPLAVRPGVVAVSSRTRLGVEHFVTMPTCSCEHFDKSHRAHKWHEGHIAAALTQGNMIPLPTGDWVELSDEQIQLLAALAKEQRK